MNKKLNIILLDDHSLFLNGMKHLLSKSFEINFRSFNSIKKLNKADLNFNNYDLFISDLELPNEDIFSFFRIVRNNFSIPILVISMHKKISFIRRCQEIGINGYILKNDDEYLISAVDNIIEGKEYYSPMIKRVINDFSANKKIISEREEQVIKHICDGQSNLKISEFLSITVETVKTHKKNIRIKLGVSDTAELIDYAKKNILF